MFNRTCNLLNTALDTGILDYSHSENEIQDAIEQAYVELKDPIEDLEVQIALEVE